MKKNTFEQKIAFGIGGGGFYLESDLLLKKISQHHNFIAIIPSDSESLKKPILDEFKNCSELYMIPAVTNFSLQNKKIMKFMYFFKAIYLGYRIINKEKPFTIIVLGSSIAIPLFVAARLNGIKTVFVESITRVDKPSKTIKIVEKYKLANKIYVQWPDLLSKVNNSIYKGTIL